MLAGKRAWVQENELEFRFDVYPAIVAFAREWTPAANSLKESWPVYTTKSYGFNDLIANAQHAGPDGPEHRQIYQKLMTKRK